MRTNMKFVFLCICLVFHGIITVNADDNSINNSNSPTRGPNTFNVIDFGAKADGVTDNSKAFLAAWDAACNASGVVTILVPSGNYFLKPVQFTGGPCRNVQTFTFQLQGTLKASTDLNEYDNRGWVQFGWVNNFVLTGGGTFDGQGEVSWPFNKCPKQKSCKLLPTSIIFVNTNNTTIKDITSLNSKLFHMGIVHSENIKISGVTITAPENSPNTDGIHLERNNGVTIINSKIGTDDDCISIGHGNSGITISGITCGPGHGISIGSLGKLAQEEDVENIAIRDCTFIGTSNGVRIKTWANTLVSISASNLTFENLVMNKVGYPVIIDQEYCPYAQCDNSSPSRIQISDVHFKNIRGTASRPEAVTIKCSKGLPCYKVTLHDIDLRSSDTTSNISTVCHNANIQFTGISNPPPC